mmetsp:Transcript_25583/g.44638  ORF Transcript_25583/g.44638 Transcript_25583/m.44638 type:complete len:447 (-) Transcript_25583:82-1422(-)
MSEEIVDYSDVSEEHDEEEDIEIANNPRIIQMHDPGSAFQPPNPAKEQMIDMGFSAEDIERVLSRFPVIEEAIEFMLSSGLPSSVSTLCQICGENLDEAAVVVQDCFHSFCQSCVTDYVEIQIREGQVLRFNCPHHGCPNELTTDQVEANLSEELIQKLALFKRNEELSRNQNLRWCPKPDCQGFDIGSMRKTALKCNACGHDYCYYCGEAPHGKKKCKAEADKQLDRWSRKNGVKYCPNCKRRVMKSAGCDHMTCPRCKYQWCWLCGERFHSFHFEQCPVRIAETNNPHWYIVLGLLMAPALLPFALPILIFYSLHQNFPERSDNCFHSFIRKKWLSFPLIFITTMLLSPPIVAITLVLSGPVLLFEIRDEYLGRTPNAKCCNHICIWGPIFMIFGLALSPLIAGLVILGTVVAQFFGLGLIFIKVMFCCSRCFKKSDSAAYANY